MATIMHHLATCACHRKSMPAIDTDELSSQFVSQYRDNVFCNQQKVDRHACTCTSVWMN